MDCPFAPVWWLRPEISSPKLCRWDLSPLLQNGVAMGGFVAIFLSTLLVLFPKPRVVFRLHPRPDEMPGLIDAIHQARKKLDLNDTVFNRLQLACEETFGHLIEEVEDENEICLFDIQKREEGLFVEIICSSRVDDVDQSPRPIYPWKADEEALSKMGLLLLSKTAKDIMHIRISGNTYISFVIES